MTRKLMIIKRCIECKKIINGRGGRPNQSGYCYSCLHKLQEYNYDKNRKLDKYRG